MLRQILMFDVNRFLKSDVLTWRVPSLLLRAFVGVTIAGILLALIVPFAFRQGWPLPEWAFVVVLVGCVGACVAPWGRRKRS